MMPRGCLRSGTARCVSVKLRQETRESWVEAKRCFQKNTDDVLADGLLKLATPSATVNSNTIILCVVFLISKIYI